MIPPDLDPLRHARLASKVLQQPLLLSPFSRTSDKHGLQTSRGFRSYQGQVLVGKETRACTMS